VAERSPSRLPEMIDGNLRWLECYLQSVRGRPCVRSSSSACATGTAASWLRSRPASVLQRAVLILFLSKQNNQGRAHFCVPKFKRSCRGVLLAPQQHIHCAKRGPKQTPLYSLFPFPLVVELQPPPLSDTTLAERMPLRIPGTTITHSGP